MRIESVTGEVAIPGEVGGPALRITLEVTNSTPEDFDTPAVVVNLYKGAARSPAGSLLNPGSRAFPDKIAPRASAEGIYLFTVGPDDRDDITIEVDLAVGTPIVLFQGKVN
ncbi:DUF4352 domain-containing protein [Tessaracoccus antarcticus]|uniref:DUF4352 domain-containing protein n=1 Tax=Tessaracoccus antarcticus TaxID=2479848 RepID=A0A3M0G204_9ACTN|nr:hypothetical protein [Tessaracoccus antarcticus]RMB58147.1 hypothetical protein EAX62_13085 [Tessaracoccus antarcticus]